MLRTMIVGLDGSSYSVAAQELALRWAKRFDALVAAVGVIDEPGITAPEPVPLGGEVFRAQREAALLAVAQRQAKELLEAFAARSREAGVRCKLSEDVGVPYEQILLEAQRYDLILLGKRTQASFPAQRSPDDMLRRVLRSSPRPVVAMPDKIAQGQGVLVAYDGSLQAARSLQAFVATGLHALGDIRVLTVDAKSSAVATEHARRAVEYLGFHEIAATAQPVVSNEPVGRVMLDEAARGGAELLVMGSHGRATLVEFFLGSVTSRVLDDASLPVFLFH